jgi:hypothetical protein
MLNFNGPSVPYNSYLSGMDQWKQGVENKAGNYLNEKGGLPKAR